jgi:hypothetical protein
MRMRGSGLIVAGAVASLGLLAIAPTWLNVGVAGTAAIGWCLYLEREDHASDRQAFLLVRDRAGRTLDMLGGTDARTRSAIDAANRRAGHRPARMVVFVVRRARRGVAAMGSTERRS